MKAYKVQHNGRGKSHLLNIELELLCSTNGDFCFSDHTNLVIEDNKYFEVCGEIRYEISRELAYFKYCNKCLKLAENKV